MSVFHLAYTVTDLESTRRFYGGLLGCIEGRSSETWVDFNFFGNQLSLHVGEVIKISKTSSSVEGVSVPMPHFGCVLDWNTFYDLAHKLQSEPVKFIITPNVRFVGQSGEQATMFFEDYSGNSIELKAYKNSTEVFSK
jgi:uncharacterized protein